MNERIWESLLRARLIMSPVPTDTTHIALPAKNGCQAPHGSHSPSSLAKSGSPGKAPTKLVADLCLLYNAIIANIAGDCLHTLKQNRPSPNIYNKPINHNPSMS